MTTSLGNYQYIIDQTAPFTVHIWGGANSDLNGPEAFLQPHNPDDNNADWSDAATAEAWAIKLINDIENPQPITPTAPTPQEIQDAQTMLAASGYIVTAPVTPVP